MKRIGPYSALVYALLMVWAYSSQIIKLFHDKDVSSFSKQFICVALIAVVLRIFTLGSAIREIWQKARIRSLSNISLAIAELVVLFGLAIIFVQITSYS
ncbi:hypothetical protein K8R42_02160 [bacterium]|nr:hypothetical protein [bacterium]